jgi:cell division septum initiation protein DivIVA
MSHLEDIVKSRFWGPSEDEGPQQLVNKVKEYEANFKAQAEAQKTEIEDLRRQLAEAKENCALAQANQEISEYWKNCLEKNVEELHKSKERCFEKSLDCVKKLKTSFAKVGAYSTEENFIWGDHEGVVEWISGEAEAFEEILSDRGDVCVFSGVRGISAILEKAGCDHVKTMAQAEAVFSVDDTKDPSAEATLMGGKFYNDVWVNGGRELAHDIIKKSEKDTHDARVEARRAEEATEREKRIGIIFWFLALVFVLWLRTN